METEYYCEYCDTYRVEREGHFCSESCAKGYWNDMNQEKDDELL